MAAIRGSSGTRPTGAADPVCSVAVSFSNSQPLGSVTLAISARSWSSVASQNSGIASVPCAVSSSAICSAETAFNTEYSGPPSTPTCCPLMQATAPRRKRSIEASVSADAPHSRFCRSRTSATRARRSAGNSKPRAYSSTSRECGRCA